MARCRRLLRASVATIAGAMAIASTALAGTEGVEKFVGTYVGGATVETPGTGKTQTRDMDIVINLYKKTGLRIRWINVTHVDGRRDVPGVRRRVSEVVFVPSETGDFFVATGEFSPFKEEEEMTPMRGDPVRWATIDGDHLYVYSFVVQEDGRYELQIYDRQLTDDGIDIAFHRFVDGEVQRRITGRTVRAD